MAAALARGVAPMTRPALLLRALVLPRRHLFRTATAGQDGKTKQDADTFGPLTTEQFYELPDRPKSAAYFTGNQKYFDIAWDLKAKIRQAQFELLQRKETGEYQQMLLGVPDAHVVESTTEGNVDPMDDDNLEIIGDVGHTSSQTDELDRLLTYATDEAEEIHHTFSMAREFVAVAQPCLAQTTNLMAAFAALESQYAETMRLVNVDGELSDVAKSALSHWKSLFNDLLKSVADKIPGKSPSEVKVALLRQSLQRGTQASGSNVYATLRERLEVELDAIMAHLTFAKASKASPYLDSLHVVKQSIEQLMTKIQIDELKKDLEAAYESFEQAVQVALEQSNDTKLDEEEAEEGTEQNRPYPRALLHLLQTIDDIEGVITGTTESLHTLIDATPRIKAYVDIVQKYAHLSEQARTTYKDEVITAQVGKLQTELEAALNRAAASASKIAKGNHHYLRAHMRDIDQLEIARANLGDFLFDMSYPTGAELGRRHNVTDPEELKLFQEYEYDDSDETESTLEESDKEVEEGEGEDEEEPFEIDRDAYLFLDDAMENEASGGTPNMDETSLEALEAERLRKIKSNMPTWLLKRDMEQLLDTTLKVTQYRRLSDLLASLVLEPYGPMLFRDTLERFMRPGSRNRQEKKKQTIDEFGRAYGTGKRKSAVARVWVGPGDGKVVVNGQLMTDYFMRFRDRGVILEPLGETGYAGQVNVWCTVKGGGTTGQAEAIRHGVAKALLVFDEKARPMLKEAGLLRRDPRRVERKKFGQKKARKKFTWVKR